MSRPLVVLRRGHTLHMHHYQDSGDDELDDQQLLDVLSKASSDRRRLRMIELSDLQSQHAQWLEQLCDRVQDLSVCVEYVRVALPLQLPLHRFIGKLFACDVVRLTADTVDRMTPLNGMAEQAAEVQSQLVAVRQLCTSLARDSVYKVFLNIDLPEPGTDIAQELHTAGLLLEKAMFAEGQYFRNITIDGAVLQHCGQAVMSSLPATTISSVRLVCSKQHTPQLAQIAQLIKQMQGRINPLSYIVDVDNSSYHHHHPMLQRLQEFVWQSGCINLALCFTYHAYNTHAIEPAGQPMSVRALRIGAMSACLASFSVTVPGSMLRLQATLFGHDTLKRQWEAGLAELTTVLDGSFKASYSYHSLQSIAANNAYAAVQQTHDETCNDGQAATCTFHSVDLAVTAGGIFARNRRVLKQHVQQLMFMHHVTELQVATTVLHFVHQCFINGKD